MERKFMNDKDKIKKVESYRWVVWTILALLYVFVTFHRMGTGVVRNELEEDFSIGAAQFANIGSMYFYAYFIMQIPSGILADKFGPKITVTIFSLLAAAGSVIFGLAPVINVTMCWTLGNEVNDRRFSGIATGVVNCIGFFGAAVIPVIMGRILDINKNMPDAGYNKAFLVLIVLVAASFIATFFTTETGAENIYGKK
jgi:fucose permease